MKKTLKSKLIESVDSSGFIVSTTEGNTASRENAFSYWQGTNIADPCSPSTTVVVDSTKTVTAVFKDNRECGDSCHPYPALDFNEDCRVNTADFAFFAAGWMECTHPDCD